MSRISSIRIAALAKKTFQVSETWKVSSMSMSWLLVMTVAMGLFGIQQAKAQGDDGWSEPINLSLSGAAGAPQIVIDSEDTRHVFWEDQFSGIMYVQGSGTNWSTPVVAQLPVTDTIPLMVADENQQIHAFWSAYDSVNDVDLLQYGRVPAGQLASSSAWTPPVTLSNTPITWQALVGNNGQLHLAYIQQTASGANLAYRQSNDEGDSWSTPTIIYDSAYLRLAEQGHINLNLIEADASTLLLAWEDEAREQVLTARSNNNGTSWAATQVIDQREVTDSASAIGPRDVRLTRNGDEVHLVWQAGHENAICSQYHQVSLDGGNAWEPRRQILVNMRECLDDLQLFSDGVNVVMALQTPTGVLFTVWDGVVWSNLQLQPTLVNFNNAETRRQVNLDCGIHMISTDTSLMAVGCGTSLGQDVWFSERNLSDIANMLITPPTWDIPRTVTDSGLILSPNIVADNQGGIHALWSEADPAGNALNLPEGKTIVYSRLDNERWSEPIRLFDLPAIQADQLSVAISASDRLLAVWRERSQGDISFTWATANRASLNDEWSFPTALPIPQPGATAPDIAVDPAGTVFVAYAIPVNESRGIYLTTSLNEGINWEPYELVFDGLSAGWDMVDAPKLAVAGQDQLHLMWWRRSLTNSGAVPYYSRSTDGGLTWSLAEEIAYGNDDAEAVQWSHIVGNNAGEVHRFWQVVTGQAVTLWHQWSLDNGETWQSAQQLVGFGEAIVGTPALVLDKRGQPNLVQTVQDSEDANVLLQHWVWENENWVLAGLDALDRQTATSQLVSSATFAPSDELFVLYTGKREASTTPFDSLFSTDREYIVTDSLPEPGVSVQPEVITAPTVVSEAETEATPEPPVFAFLGENASGSLPFAGQPLVRGAVLAVVPAIFVVIAGVVFFGRRNRRG